MASKLFLDANVLLDFTFKREGYSDAKEIIQLVIDGQVQAFITPSIVHIAGYWLTKAYKRQSKRNTFSLTGRCTCYRYKS